MLVEILLLSNRQCSQALNQQEPVYVLWENAVVVLTIFSMYS